MIGSTILHYKILEKLGEGGMGVVYKAEDVKLKRTVALKFLPPYIASSAEDLARFTQEAQAAAILNHPNICIIYAIEEANSPEGKKQNFISMEFIDGFTLSKKIGVAPLKTNDAISYAVQIGEALQEAHTNGIIHRDIKTENIMVNSKNQIKVMDFGLAKLKDSLKLTKSSSTVGTLSYMSPEQIQKGNIDARSDIFSFGVVLFEILTGSLPFRGEHDASIMYSILNEEPEPLKKYLPDAPSNLIHIIERCLEKDAEDRYQTMHDIVIELKRINKHTGGVSRTISAGDYIPTEKSSTSLVANVNEEAIGIKSSEPVFKNKKLIVGLSALIMLIALLSLYLLLNKKEKSFALNKSVAILPFKNLSSDKNDEYFSDGITEDLTVDLSQIGDLNVIARNSTMQYKNSDASFKEIGNALGVSAVLNGSVQKEGNEIRIVAQLIDVNTGKYLWAGSYDKKLEQIFAVQSDVSKQIANALKAKLTPGEESRINKKPTDNITAYQYYLKGREYYYRYTRENNETAIKLFKEALRLDPDYALAYAGLADCYGQGVFRFGLSEGWNDTAIVMSKKAISIDPNLAEGYKAMALIQLNNGRIRECLETNKKAVEVNPNYWPAVGNLGVCYSLIGDFVNALYWTNKAQQLNPRSGVSYDEIAMIYITLLDYQRAESNLKLALKIQPDLTFIYQTYIMLHFARRNYQQAILDCNKILSLVPDEKNALYAMGIAYTYLKNFKKASEYFEKVTESNNKVYADIYLAYISKKNGNLKEASNLIHFSKGVLQKKFLRGNELNLDAVFMSMAELIVGNKGEAYKWLNKAVDWGFRDYNWLMKDPLMESIRNEASFKKIIETIKNKVDEQRTLLGLANMEG